MTKKIITKNIYAPIRKTNNGQTVTVREVFKREKYTISKLNKITNITAFEPKTIGQEGFVKLLPGQQYGNKNIFINGSGLILRVEVNIYNPQGLPFDFHTRDSSGGIAIDTNTTSPTFNKEIGAYQKLKELRKCFQNAKVIHKLDINDIPIEDKLDNYIHAPHIDEKTGRETSIYTRYSSASQDNRLGRVMGLELDSTLVYRFIIESEQLLCNEILDGCELVFEALVLEDTKGLS